MTIKQRLLGLQALLSDLTGASKALVDYYDSDRRDPSEMPPGIPIQTLDFIQGEFEAINHVIWKGADVPNLLYRSLNKFTDKYYEELFDVPINESLRELHSATVLWTVHAQTYVSYLLAALRDPSDDVA